MTFQEAQEMFSNLVSGVSTASTSDQLVQKQHDLQNLLSTLPNTAEFDPIANAIAEFSPKLAGRVTQAVLLDLQTRDAGLRETTALLKQVSTKAEANAKDLTFSKPKLVAAALSESVSQIKELAASAKTGDIEAVMAKAQALATLFENVKSTITEQ